MAAEKKGGAPPNEKPKEEAKPQQSKSSGSSAKNRKVQPPQRSIIGTIFSWLMVGFLGIIFMALLGVIVILFDFLGIMRVRDYLPAAWLESGYVKDYVREAEIIKASEESKIKALIHEQESSYKDLSETLKRKEIVAEEKLVKLSIWEKELRDRELDVVGKEKELAKKLKEFEDKKTQRVSSEQSIEQFAKVYERMDPQLAADALLKLDDYFLFEIISKMKDKKGALILEKLPSEKVLKITEMIKKAPPKDTAEVAMNNSGGTNETALNK